MAKMQLIQALFALAQSGDREVCDDLFNLIREKELEGAVVGIDGIGSSVIYDPENHRAAHQYSKELRKICAQSIKNYGDSMYLELYRKTLLFDAPSDFDAFCRYIELEREPAKRFYEPRRKQLLPAVQALQDLEDDKLDLLAISEPPGVGKALANDTPILTRKGWKNHGDLVVGDEVIGLNGEFKKVIAVHPKCQLDVLVEFTNGEKIQCHERHEWMIHDRRLRRTLTEEIQFFEKRDVETGEPGHRGHRYHLQLPKHGYIVGEHKDLLDPYLFGAWLGDGSNKSPRIANPKGDKAIIDRIVSNGTPVKWSTEHKETGVMYYDFDIRSQLREYGLCHSRKICPKYIPEDYLTASIEQRLQLLAGLIDTDGTIGGNKYQYSTTEPLLKDTFIELLSTFGWRACVSAHEPRVSSSGIVGRKVVYVISFTPDCTIPCVLPRKCTKEPRKQRRIAIKSISRVEPKEGNCITVEGDGMYLAGKTMLPTHNTTLAIFYLCWIAGRNPELTILGGSHSNSFLRGVYEEILRIIGNDSEYLYKDVFPEASVVKTNSKDLRIDLQKSKRFETFEFSSIGSGNAGKVRASKLLYCDDLVEGIEAAMNRDRMDKLWQQYYTDLRQRKIGNAKELHIATRWSVVDPIGRLEAQYADNSRAKFIRFSALDENDESNFDYPYGVGFTTEFYHEQREIMDDASWRALYCNEPIEREGLLYAEDELRRYFELPDREPDAIIAVCDTKSTGTDYCVMPIVYKYGRDLYIEDVLCENYSLEVIEPKLAQLLTKHKVQLAQFESNAAGGKVAEKVQGLVKEQGGICKITTKWTQSNKDTKIIVNAPYVKEHCLFKDASLIKSHEDIEYRTMLKFLCGYTMAGRNKHDDVPDAFAQLALYLQNFGGNTVTIGRRIF